MREWRKRGAGHHRTCGASSALIHSMADTAGPGLRAREGCYESGCPSRVVINTREVWKVEHGNARELLNVGSLSSISDENSCARARVKGSQLDDTRIATSLLT